MNIPRAVTAPNFSRVRRTVVDGIKTLVKEQREPKDFEHAVFEKVMEAVYGPTCWEWFNQLLEDIDG